MLVIHVLDSDRVQCITKALASKMKKGSSLRVDDEDDSGDDDYEPREIESLVALSDNDEGDELNQGDNVDEIIDVLSHTALRKNSLPIWPSSQHFKPILPFSGTRGCFFWSSSE